MRVTSFTTTDGNSLLLEGVKARGRVVGRMLDMTLEQRFRNPESVNVEVVYTFPLPWHAVLLGLEVELNGEVLIGAVQRKAIAREKYEGAVSEGDSAVLVAVNKDRTYTLELGNLMANESCVVRLHYVQVLQPEQGSLRLILPTTLAPRYGDAVRDGGYEPHAAPAVSATLEYPFDICLDIQGELVHSKISSPSHSVAIRSIPAVGMNESFMTQVQLGSKAWLDRDFLLVFDKLEHASLGLAAWDRLDPGLGVLMTSFTPKLPTKQSLPVTLKVLVDCSGSMGGDSIQAARSALQAVLRSLRDGDRFSLSRFGDTTEHRCKALWKIKPPSMAAAQRWVERLEADLGGTQMNEAILSTLSLPGSDHSDVLLITDGEIQAIDEVVESAQHSGHRFFVVGIGSSVAEGLLRRLASQTGGSCEFVTAGEHVEAAIHRLYQRMRSPVVSHARVVWPAECQVHAASDLPKSVFDGDDITVFARLNAQQAQALTGSVKLLGQLEGVEGEVCLAETKPTFIADESNTLARLAASQRYWQLKAGSEAVPAVLTKQLPALAEKYQLITDDTSFVLVKYRSDAARAVDMPELRQVPGMLAAGWGGFGSLKNLTLPKTVHADVQFSIAPDSATGLSLPSVWRTNRTSNHAASILDTDIGLGEFDTLKLLRKRSTDGRIPQPKEVGWTSPPPKSFFWIAGSKVGSSKVAKALTPAGLVEGLRLNKPENWPRTFRELAKVRVAPRVIEWLELCVGTGHDEQDVVRSFLEVVNTLEFTVRQKIDAVLGGHRSMGGGGKDDMGLRQLIADALSGAIAEEWPSAILDYAEEGNL